MTHRNFGIQTVRPALGGVDTRASRHGAGGTRANLISFPPLPRGSISDPGSSSLKSRDMSDAARDRIVVVAVIAFFVGVGAAFLLARFAALCFIQT